MLLATYQPYVLMPEHRNDQYECFRGKLDGEYPVFCFPARSADEFRFRSLLAAPVKPERLILIDTDEYARFDAVEWNRILCLPRDDAAFRERFERMFDGVDERFSEYVVKPHELDSSVDEVDIKRLIEEEDFAFVEDESYRQKLLAAQESARAMVENSLESGEGDNARDFDFPSMVRLNSFVMFLGGFTYNAMVGKPTNLIDAIPFLPDKVDNSSLNAWHEFNELRYLVYDKAEGGNHRDYIAMADALTMAVGIERQNMLSRHIGRNAPCPCMSGRKYKSCHGKKPIDIYPFL